jgi:hypothetical protein
MGIRVSCGHAEETHVDTHNFPDGNSFDGMCVFNTTGVNFKAVKINLLKTMTQNIRHQLFPRDSVSSRLENPPCALSILYLVSISSSSSWFI